MKIRLSQLRRIIREEVSRSLVEGIDAAAKAEEIAKDNPELVAALKAALQKLGKKDPGIIDKLTDPDHAEEAGAVVAKSVKMEESRRRVYLDRLSEGMGDMSIGGTLGGAAAGAFLMAAPGLDLLLGHALAAAGAADLPTAAVAAVCGALIGFVASDLPKNLRMADAERRRAEYAREKAAAPKVYGYGPGYGPR